jgi:hypothetical protein
MRRLPSKAISILIGIVLLSSCRKETKIVYQIVAADSAYVSITNASPSISNLLIYVDDNFVHLPDSPLSFGNTTLAAYVSNINQINQVVQQLPYIKIPVGYNNLTFNSQSPGASFLMEGFFESGTNYSVFITDSVAHGQAQTVFLQDYIGPSDTAHGQVRFLNLSPDAPALDVYAFLDAGPNGYLLFSNCAYLPNDYNSVKNAETFTAMPVGPYYFVATAAGTANVVLEGGLIISPKSIVTIYAKGFAAGSGANAISVGVILYQAQ